MIDSSKRCTIVRTFMATPKEVWHAWTDPNAAAQWWHPRGTTTPRDTVEMDVRVGDGYFYDGWDGVLDSLGRHLGTPSTS